ncbi:protein translocase subunit secY/sec61 alpha [Anaerobacterium chartisolvens]|uniref:Protein translocase subunit SecY n=1 Tax=Anaerobacterium chartisolvens TaxID=1297424 RepID=A0A369AZ98_9FIRM|nr:preprotein translocase subunit SecY [Anaerobacterium chartisolvens]RCX12774.1 protein translocase subunit secY/sec61 alpha [Anaerobacterium chartisolvens]
MGGMFETLRNAWKIPDLRRKILFTVAMLIVYRIGSHIPVPFLDASEFKKLVESGGSLFGMFDIVTGGAFKLATIFAMSITPYINSSIIMQLLTVAIPKLEQLQKEGEEGRKIIAQYVRYGTVVLGFIQAVGLFIGLGGAVVGGRNWLTFITITLTFTAGTAFLMWLGEQITEYGIGNGISLIIFAGIVSSGPAAAMTLMNYYTGGQLGEGVVGILAIIAIVLVFIAVVSLVIWVNQAERRIPVQYAKRVVGRKVYGGQSTHIPIKVNLAGVIPIIFAMSITMFPSQMVTFFAPNSTNWFVLWLKNSTDSIWYSLIYALLIMFFTFFYTVIQFNPIEIANNMKKNGGFIPGIRPGKPTSDYISKVLNRITWFGGLFLALITIFPVILGAIFNISGLFFGGTALLILVGVALDTVKQIESQMLMRHYKGFLE